MARGQNLLEKIYNKPLLISTEALQPISDYLSSPDRVASLKMESVTSEAPKLASFDSDEKYRKAVLEHYKINPETMTGILNIEGVLVNREGQMNAQCVELTSYQGLKKQFEAQIELGMKSCVLMVNSSGGEAFAAWSTATYVKKLAKENDVKLTTYINGSACSAAYVWAVVADEVISHPMGSAGSIGVLVQLYNDSKMLEKAGYSRSFVYAGGNKIPFDKDGNFTDKFISDLQKSVDNTYSKFVNHVVSNRNMSEAEVIETNASVFDAEDAIRLKLVDKIMELEDFEIAYGLKANKNGFGNGISLQNTSPIGKQLTNKQEENMDELAKLQAQLADMTTQLGDAQASLKDQTDAVAKLTEEQLSLQESVQTLTKSLELETKAKEALQDELNTIKADAITADRKQRLESVLGTENDQVASLLTSTENLSEEAFSSIVTAMSLKVEKEDKEMEEHGKQAEQDTATTNPFQEALLKSIKKQA